MRRFRRLAAQGAAHVALALAALCGGLSVSRAAGEESGLEFFERKIRPVLVERCYRCHAAAAGKAKGGLRLDLREGLLRGGDSGPAVVPGKPNESLLWHAVSYSGRASEMPPDARLPAAAIADFRAWIEQGAALPADEERNDAGPRPVEIEAGRRFWSFQPLREAALPQVARGDWPRRRSDHFILAKLEAAGLAPSPEAERAKLCRRVHLDLLGLPPTFEETAAFAADDSADAYERLVERCLASPHYGERWGRHWLDVARYAEDNPTSESTCKPPRFPWRYRDWVIRALNDDLPYADFVRRQMAADQLDLPSAELAALGFLGLSPVYHKEPKLSAEVISQIVANEWDERLDAVTRGFLGLTVACARCHDHKFDPLRMEDYYALAGVLASTQLVEWPLAETTREEAEALTETRRQIVDTELRLSYAKEMRRTAESEGRDAGPFAAAAARLEAALAALKNRKLYEGPIANAVRDAGLWVDGSDPAWTLLDYRPGASRDLPLFARGNPQRPGAIVPRRFLEVLSPPGGRPFRHGSGRREWAEALVGDAGPLAARVIVNRVWGWHYGRPLVGTPSNFGQQGERPTHPELLDDLAARFVASGWSLKWLHREILCSAAWRQSSGGSEESRRLDPDHRLLSRFARRRLELEAWRDAVLAACGQLDVQAGGPSGSLDDPAFRRRSVYAAVTRQRPPDLHRLFDFPDAKQHAEVRLPSTTPLQQLYLLNSPFLQEQARALAAEVVAQEFPAGEAPAKTRVRALFRRVLLREPSDEEAADGAALAGDIAGPRAIERWAALIHALLATNEFLHLE